MACCTGAVIAQSRCLWNPSRLSLIKWPIEPTGLQDLSISRTLANRIGLLMDSSKALKLTNKYYAGCAALSCRFQISCLEFPLPYFLKLIVLVCEDIQHVFWTKFPECMPRKNRRLSTQWLRNFVQNIMLNVLTDNTISSEQIRQRKF